MKNLRLDKLLAKAGYGSRKEVKRIIRTQDIHVNGEIIKSSGFIVDPNLDQVTINGEEVHYQEYYYFMLNKPQGYVSATQDNLHPTVIDLLDYEHFHLEVFPVGRLDIDTQGLLLLTNDGSLAHRLTSPNKEVPKTYYAEVEGRLDQEDILAFKEGLDLDDFIAKPAELEILESDFISQALVTITEGKFHQVKRMFRAQDKEVLFLERISMGSLELDPELELGSYRELSEDEVKRLQNK